MSRKYKMNNPDGIYFITFTVINWIDVFIRENYFGILIDSMNFCTENKGMTIYCYCIMPSHVHMIFGDRNRNPSKLLMEFKGFTSRALRKEISFNTSESRRKWILKMMRDAGRQRANVKEYQFWQQHNHPIELWSNHFIDKKMNYIHNNPVVAGFVEEPHHWKYSSARDYAGNSSAVLVTLID